LFIHRSMVVVGGNFATDTVDVPMGEDYSSTFV